MAALILTIAKERSLRRQRVFRDRTNPLDACNDLELIRRYRFPRHSLLELIKAVEESTRRPTHRSHSLPVTTMVCLCYLFY